MLQEDGGTAGKTKGRRKEREIVLKENMDTGRVKCRKEGVYTLHTKMNGWSRGGSFKEIELSRIS
jgi:hypothetical protein